MEHTLNYKVGAFLDSIEDQTDSSTERVIVAHLKDVMVSGDIPEDEKVQALMDECLGLVDIAIDIKEGLAVLLAKTQR